MNWRDKLYRELKSRGWTYSTIGAELGLTESAIGHYFKGRREPSVKTLRKMAELGGMSLNDLFEDDGKYLVVDDKEINIIEKIRYLSPEKKTLILDLLSSLSAPPETPKPPRSTRRKARP